MGSRGATSVDEWWRSVAAAAGCSDGVLAAHAQARDDLGRWLQTDSAPVFALSFVDCYREFLERAGELGFTDVVAPCPRAEGVFAGREDVLEDVAAEVLVHL